MRHVSPSGPSESTTQVSPRGHIVCESEMEAPASNLVRCVECHAVYEQRSDERAADAASQACPECGETTWIAPEIPVAHDAGAAAG